MRDGKPRWTVVLSRPLRVFVFWWAVQHIVYYCFVIKWGKAKGYSDRVKGRLVTSYTSLYQIVVVRCRMRVEEKQTRTAVTARDEYAMQSVA